MYMSCGCTLIVRNIVGADLQADTQKPRQAESPQMGQQRNRKRQQQRQPQQQQKEQQQQPQSQQQQPQQLHKADGPADVSSSSSSAVNIDSSSSGGTDSKATGSSSNNSSSTEPCSTTGSSSSNSSSAMPCSTSITGTPEGNSRCSRGGTDSKATGSSSSNNRSTKCGTCIAGTPGGKSSSSSSSSSLSGSAAEVGDAGLQVLAAACSEWHQQLAELQQQQLGGGEQRNAQAKEARVLLPLQRSQLGKWRQPLQMKLEQFRVAANAGQLAHDVILQQQLGAAAAAYVGMPSNSAQPSDGAVVKGDCSAVAAAVTALSAQIRCEYGTRETAVLAPAAMQLTLEAIALVHSIMEHPTTQQQQQQQLMAELTLLSELHVLLRLQQFNAYIRCEDHGAPLADWPWEAYLQVELLLLQRAGQAGDGQQAQLKASTTNWHLFYETPRRFCCDQA
jgi:hypothetical protein